MEQIKKNGQKMRNCLKEIKLFQKKNKKFWTNILRSTCGVSGNNFFLNQKGIINFEV